MRVANTNTTTKAVVSNISQINNNINRDNTDKNQALNTINKNRVNILSNYILYKRIVGYSLNFSGQYLTKKKKRKVKPYSMSKGPLYNNISLFFNKYNNLSYNKYPGYISIYSKPSTYNKTIIGKIGLNTKITLI